MQIQFGAMHRIPLKVNASAFGDMVKFDPAVGYVGRVEGDTLVLITNDSHGDGQNAAAAIAVLAACRSNDLKTLYQKCVDAVFDHFQQQPKDKTLL